MVVASVSITRQRRWFRLSARRAIAALALVGCNIAALGAQTPSCGYGVSTLRTGLGAAVGGWLGFVAMKIRFSDWDDASRGVEARRSLNRVTITSAVVGLTVANLGFRARKCEQVKLAAAPPAIAATGPITAAEIRDAHVQGTAYDLVLRLRRGWLFGPGAKALSDSTIVVYVNDARLGILAALKTVPVADVISVQHFDGAEATFKWGLGHSHGAIQVRTLSR